ncbi:Ribosomal RNA small subunit methyltransferase E [Limihaloglobus sulfuriphilus]|uniref:Ribosomal RNA small subunit methyltransferase E n=1 Tax=Limihaloglobus sulfuriphilus TaxID=1851148 RepID=A0A1Q2MCL5_9BACT|nr:Ribosomal RNA small subunit methyltransferase E [Limihaloglobus sulfuriphilus]
MTGPEARHLSTVMRVKQGDPVEVFDGRGRLGVAVAENISKRSVTLNVTEETLEAPRSVGRVILAVSPPKGNRWDWLASKVTEIGVDYIYPVLFERSVRQGNAKNFIEKTTAVTVAAAKQCKRLYLPKISQPVRLEQFLADGINEASSLKVALMSLSEDTIFIDRLDPNWQKEDIVIFVGPEGGFTEEEEILIKRHYPAGDCFSVSITKNVLRTETAALSASAILCSKRNSCE